MVWAIARPARVVRREPQRDRGARRVHDAHPAGRALPGGEGAAAHPGRLPRRTAVDGEVHADVCRRSGRRAGRHPELEREDLRARRRRGGVGERHVEPRGHQREHLVVGVRPLRLEPPRRLDAGRALPEAVGPGRGVVQPVGVPLGRHVAPQEPRGVGLPDQAPVLVQRAGELPEVDGRPGVARRSRSTTAWPGSASRPGGSGSSPSPAADQSGETAVPIGPPSQVSSACVPARSCAGGA